MEQLDLNTILNRKAQEKVLYESLDNFERNKKDMLVRRGIYIYGSPGSGKTEFVKKILNKLNYDVIYYDEGDVRNKSVIQTLNFSTYSFSTFNYSVW